MNKLKRLRLYIAYRALMGTGMVMVNTEDWKAILDTSTALGLYVQTSGHINNRKYKARKRLRGYASQLILHQQRFVHPARTDVLVPNALIGEHLRKLG